MTTPTDSSSYREIRSSRTYEQPPLGSNEDLEKQIIAEHLGSGWVQDKGTDEELVFSTALSDGKKWTRHYDRKTCRYICQRIYEIEEAIKCADWPPVHFGD